MTLTIILSVFLGLSLATLLVIALKKAPQLKVVDPSSAPEVKARERRYAVLQGRLMRLGGERSARLRRAVFPLVKRVQESFRRFAGRLTALERAYTERQKRAGKLTITGADIRRMVDEAEEFLATERYEAAEKKLIEVLSLDPKNVRVYEKIGRLYLDTKNVESAKEAFSFAHKLDPRDASIAAALGEIAEMEGNYDKAVDYYSVARDKSPNNPRYLDFYISAAARVGKVHEATVALDRLREVNPDNQKIPDLEAEIQEAREKNVAIKETK